MRHLSFLAILVPMLAQAEGRTPSIEETMFIKETSAKRGLLISLDTTDDKFTAIVKAYSSGKTKKLKMISFKSEDSPQIVYSYYFIPQEELSAGIFLKEKENGWRFPIVSINQYFENTHKSKYRSYLPSDEKIGAYSQVKSQTIQCGHAKVIHGYQCASPEMLTLGDSVILYDDSNYDYIHLKVQYKDFKPLIFNAK